MRLVGAAALSFAMLFLAALLLARAESQAASPDTIRVTMDAAEADAVLLILEKGQAHRSVDPQDWQRLFSTDGYRRLLAREAAMKRPFTSSEFEAFVSSPELVARTDALAKTLALWKTVDVTAAARRALAYLPADARIEATVFLMIKPKPNSFVFSEPTRAIFLAVDPSVTGDKLANTLAHELHHIGFDSSCPPAFEDDTKKQPPGRSKAWNWLGAFGEGFAMLAAAGSPEVHPHAASRPEDRARWDRDIKNADRDLETLDRFFRDVAEGRLAGSRADERAFTFFGVQGAWYTVGYRMAVTIERAFGRDEMIRCFCDFRRLPSAYNLAADRLHLGGARWSLRLLRDVAASRAPE